MQEVRVRFPPSPTGYLHIGGARTAIYNWLFARKHGGTLILRIEDTDAERSTQESIEGIVNGLTWLGLDWNEGPYFQSDHISDHLAAAARLVAEKKAYKCFCAKEELDAKREKAVAAKKTYQYDGTCRTLTGQEIAAREKKGLPFVIRFAVPREPGEVAFNDAVYGTIVKKYADIEDFVIVRSNGRPLYLLSNVVDDIRDRITHVIRGQDGLGNTPRQILLYQALDAPLPLFAHMSLTLDPQKAKISKRSHGEVVTVQFYREHGFLPWALVNFLVLLGWSSSDDREIYSKEDLINAFTLEGLSKVNAVFNYHKDDAKFFTDPKALSINAHYIRTLPLEELRPLFKEELRKSALWDETYEGENKKWFSETIDLIRSRFHTLNDIGTQGLPYFSDQYPLEEKAVKKNLLKHPELATWLPELAGRIEALDSFTTDAIEETIRAFAEERDIKAGILINATRTVVTGLLAGPGLFDLLAAIGQTRVVARLRDTSRWRDL